MGIINSSKIIKDRLNYENFENLIKGTILIRWCSFLKRPSLILQIFFVIYLIGAIYSGFQEKYFDWSWLVGLCIGIYLTRKNFLSRNDQLILLLLVWYFLKFILCLIIIAVTFQKHPLRSDDLFYLLLACIWIPSIEFTKINQRHPYVFFFIRWAITLVLIFTFRSALFPPNDGDYLNKRQNLKFLNSDILNNGYKHILFFNKK